MAKKRGSWGGETLQLVSELVRHKPDMVGSPPETCSSVPHWGENEQNIMELLWLKLGWGAAQNDPFILYPSLQGP